MCAFFAIVSFIFTFRSRVEAREANKRHEKTLPAKASSRDLGHRMGDQTARAIWSDMDGVSRRGAATVSTVFNRMVDSSKTWISKDEDYTLGFILCLICDG